MQLTTQRQHEVFYVTLNENCNELYIISRKLVLRDLDKNIEKNSVQISDYSNMACIALLFKNTLRFGRNCDRENPCIKIIGLERIEFNLLHNHSASQLYYSSYCDQPANKK